jgi:hypothetical protein
MNDHIIGGDPTPRELQGQINALKALMDERGKRYEEAFVASSKAVDAALTAAKEQVSTAFVSAEKAIVKAERSQDVYNQTHNDLQRRMTEEGKEFAKRVELEREAKRTEERFADFRRTFDEYQLRLAAELEPLKGYRSNSEGRLAGSSGLLVTLLAVGGFMISLVLAVVVLIAQFAVKTAAVGG